LAHFSGIVFKLAHVEVIIEALPFQKLQVGTLFDNLTIINYKDDISISNCTKSMRYDEVSSPLHQCKEGLLEF